METDRRLCAGDVPRSGSAGLHRMTVPVCWSWRALWAAIVAMLTWCAWPWARWQCQRPSCGPRWWPV